MLKSYFSNIVHFIITAASLFMIVLLVLFSNKTGQVELVAGSVSNEDIYAPRSVVDTVTTEIYRKAARDEVKEVYVHNPEKKKTSVADISSVFTVAERLRNNNGTINNSAQSLINESPVKEITSDTAKEIIKASDSTFAVMKKSIQIVSSAMDQEVSDVEVAQKQCSADVDMLGLNSKQKSAVNELISKVLTVNYAVDAEKTELERENAANAVADVEYKKNQLIVGKGQIVTEAHIEMLKTLGILKGTSPFSITYMLGVCLLIFIGYTIILFYFWSSRNKDTVSLPILSIVGLLVVLFSFYANKYLPESLISLMPMGILPGIVSIFSVPQTAIIANLVLSIFCGVAFNGSWNYTISLIIAGTMSAYAFSTVKRRSHLLPAAIASSVCYGITFCAMSAIESSGALSAFAALGKGFLGGLLSGLITIGSIQFFEWMFNATTPMKLSELTNPENKLLKKLLVEAPGTYHHSLTVANISEIAARSIHANSLLARVGAYYHDIGKIRHPLYFKENQYDQNAHDMLSPLESSSIITQHVADGYDIAVKNRLPKIICDIIQQHHGTTNTGYFLIRARELDPDVDETKFRYSGPVPQTKEAAIVMLADSCEAAVRSIDEKSEAKIESMVRKIATDRVNTGQLSQCNLTFSELETVIKVITKTLGGYFHERIKYE